MPKQLPASLKSPWCTNGQQWVSQISQQIHAVKFSPTQRRHVITNASHQHAPSHERTSYEHMFVPVASIHRCHRPAQFMLYNDAVKYNYAVHILIVICNAVVPLKFILWLHLAVSRSWLYTIADQDEDSENELGEFEVGSLWCRYKFV